MKGTRGLFLSGVSAFVLSFVVIGFALTAASCASAPYVPATWTMEEADKIVYSSSTVPLNPNEEKKAELFGSSEADAKDGVAIRKYAESEQAKEGVWYVLTSPERPDQFFYAYNRRGDWIVTRVKPYEVLEYISASWIMEESKNAPPRDAKNLVSATETATSRMGTAVAMASESRKLGKDPIPPRDEGRFLGKIFGVIKNPITNADRGKCYVFTSPERLGETYYLYCTGEWEVYLQK